MRLSARLTVVFGLFGLALVAAIASLSWFIAANEIRGSVDDELINRSALVEGITDLEPEVIEEFARQPTTGRNVFGVEGSGGQLFDRSGTVLGQNAFDLPVTIARPACPYGTPFDVVTTVIDAVAAGQPVPRSAGPSVSIDARWSRTHTARDSMRPRTTGSLWAASRTRRKRSRSASSRAAGGASFPAAR